MTRHPAADSHARFVRDNTAFGYAPLVPEIKLFLASEVTPLWQATEAILAKECLPPPFWAFAWPGGQALARLLIDRPELAHGKAVLDFASGGGIAAIAAAQSGAKSVTACEIDPFAAAAIALNAAQNNTDIHIVHNDMVGIAPTGYGLILAGDVCYERPMAEKVLAWLTDAVAQGADVLIADPGRSYLPSTGLTELARYDVPTSLDIEDRTMMTAVVYRLMPPT